MILGEFRVRRRLGRGFFGEVYKVEKKMGSDSFIDRNDYAARVAKRCHYNIELEVFKRTAGHPYLVQLMTFFETKVCSSCLNVGVCRQLLILKFTVTINIKYIINEQDAILAVLCLLTTISMLYMFRTPFACIIRSTINCNSSHWCLSWVGLE